MATINIKTFLPFLLLIASGCFNSKTPETYLIPDGYQGKITIVFEQENGQKEEFEGNRRLYRVDSNGILITQFKSEDGTLNQQYYYIKSDGSRLRVNIDSSLFWQDSSRIKSYLTKNYNNILIRHFGVAGQYGGGTDFPKQVPFSESIIADGHFMDTCNLEKLDNRHSQVIISRLQ